MFLVGGRSARALFEAIEVGDVSAMEGHIAAGAGLEARDEAGRTPLLAACASGHLRAAARLLAHGADVRARDDQGSTTLLALLEGTARARLLADVAALRRQAGKSIEALRSVVREVAARTEALGAGGPPALLVTDDFRTLVGAFLEGGARVDVVDELGRNALAIAVCEGYPLAVVEALLRHGADSRRADEDGLTALDFAELHPDPEVRALFQLSPR
jgi:hypothetical protein